MGADRLTIVSADCHAGPRRMGDFRPFVESRFLEAFDEYCVCIDRYEDEIGSGLEAGGAPSYGETGLWDWSARTRCLDADGVAAEIIYAQGSVPFHTYPAVGGGPKMDFAASPEQVAAGCRAYNRWLAELCASDPRRHIGIARVPLPDIDAAVAEVEWAAKAGLRGGVHMPAIVSAQEAPYFNHPMYEPFWAACAANGMVLNMHGGANLSYGTGPESFALTLAEVDWMSHRGLSHLIFSGVFERYPALHLAMTEQRNHWLHPLLDDFDSVYAHTGKFGRNGGLPRKPSEYFASNCFIGASFLSRPECEKRGDIGARTFMWGSDYPHGEGTWPHTAEALRYAFSCDVPPDELAAMLAGNAARCYGLNLAELAEIAARIGPAEADLREPIDVLPGEAPGDPPVRSWAFRRHGAWH